MSGRRSPCPSKGWRHRRHVDLSIARRLPFPWLPFRHAKALPFLCLQKFQKLRNIPWSTILLSDTRKMCAGYVMDSYRVNLRPACTKSVATCRKTVHTKLILSSSQLRTLAYIISKFSIVFFHHDVVHSVHNYACLDVNCRLSQTAELLVSPSHVN